MFNLLDGFLTALNDGRVLRGVVTKLLGVLAWIRVGLAVLVPLASLTGLSTGSVKVAFGVILTGLAWGAWLFAGACIAHFRARQIAALPDSPRMTSWIWVNLLRLFAEEGLVLMVMFGVMSFATVALLGGGGSSWMYLFPLAELAFFAGLMGLLGFAMVGAIYFVALTLIADIISAQIETADSLRTLVRNGTVN